MMWGDAGPQCAGHRLRSANETTGKGLEPPRRSPSEGTAIADSRPPRPEMGKPRLPLSSRNRSGHVFSLEAEETDGLEPGWRR